MRSYHIITFGCQMNEYDSERIASVLESRGMLLEADFHKADFVIINTCSVREKPQHKVDSYIGILRKNQARRGKPAIIGIMGCVAQQVGASFLKRFSCVNFVLGTDSIHLLPHMMDDILAGKRICEQSWRTGDFSIEPFQRKANSSLVTIMKGCNNFCSYCIVPYVRGREKSRSSLEIVGEVKALVAAGTKEITLLGQNVNSYGKDLGNISFPELLEEIASVDGLVRLRYMTSHPKDFSMELVQAMARHKNICPYVHLPLQSGSNAVLKQMNRHYTWEEYRDKVLAARELIPKLAFSSDFIVGFCGETEEDFYMTLDAVKTVRYESIFAFNYSPRPGTKACELVDDVPIAEKTRRLEILIALAEEVSAERYAAELGQCIEVLVEGAAKRGENIYTGRTVYNRIVNFISPSEIPAGEEVKVKITEVKRNTLFGEIVARST